jgi:hypothetical protein
MRLRKFWTGYQQPLCQAVLIEEGKELLAIPPRPAGTPARQVWCVGEWDDKLLMGRRNLVELWNRQGTELERQVYHKWLYTLHVTEKLGGAILVGSAVLDMAMLLDWNGNVAWEWWAWKDGYAPKPSAVEEDNWRNTQLTQQWQPADSCHLNSISVEPDNTLLLTLMKARKVVRVSLAQSNPKSALEFDAGNEKYRYIHDFQYDRRGGSPVPVFGAENGLWVGDRLLYRDDWPWVKRIRQLGQDEYAFTHMRGVVVCDKNGNTLQTQELPTPFGITHPEFG